MSKEESTYTCINCNKEIIFIDPLRQHYGKMSSNELNGCIQPNEYLHVCEEEIPIYSYVLVVDYESTLLHTSTTKVPSNCEYRMLKLSKTYWIPLHMFNEWLFVAPEPETFTVLCPHDTTNMKLRNTGKLTLSNECKGYSPYVTLYAMSSTTSNVPGDFVPSAPTNFECCFEDLKGIKFERLQVDVP
jgi:hypothetical protein